MVRIRPWTLSADGCESSSRLRRCGGVRRDQGCIRLGKLALDGANNALGRTTPEARLASDQSRQGLPKVAQRFSAEGSATMVPQPRRGNRRVAIAVSAVPHGTPRTLDPSNPPMNRWAIIVRPRGLGHPRRGHFPVGDGGGFRPLVQTSSRFSPELDAALRRRARPPAPLLGCTGQTAT